MKEVIGRSIRATSLQFTRNSKDFLKSINMDDWQRRGSIQAEPGPKTRSRGEAAGSKVRSASENLQPHVHIQLVRGLVVHGMEGIGFKAVPIRVTCAMAGHPSTRPRAPTILLLSLEPLAASMLQWSNRMESSYIQWCPPEWAECVRVKTLEIRPRS